MLALEVVLLPVTDVDRALHEVADGPPGDGFPPR
jgi:hypothetical protein